MHSSVGATEVARECVRECTAGNRVYAGGRSVGHPLGVASEL